MVIWDGVEYPSIEVAAWVCRVTVEHMRRRLEMGYAETADVTRAKPVQVDGVVYPSISEAARSLGVAKVTVWRWLNGK